MKNETAKFFFTVSLVTMLWGFALYSMAGWIARTPLGFAATLIVLLVSGFFVLCPRVK